MIRYVTFQPPVTDLYLIYLSFSVWPLLPPHCRCRGLLLEHVRNVMAHAQKPDLVFQRNGRVHLNRQGCQFSRLLAVEERGSADSNCIDRVPTYSARLLATHSIRIFPLHFPSRASPCAIRFWTRYKLMTLNDTRSLGLLWMKDRSIAQTST